MSTPMSNEGIGPLVEQLRKREHAVMQGPAYLQRMCETAATALSSQAAEIAELKTDLKIATENRDYWCEAAKFENAAGRKVEAEIAELRKALGFYADDDNWQDGRPLVYVRIMHPDKPDDIGWSRDDGDIARAALTRKGG